MLSTLVLVLIFVAHVDFVRAQNVGVGTNVPNASALLEVGPTVTKGFLCPRVTNTQMLAIASPATGLLVMNTTYLTYYYYNGTIWLPFGGKDWSITGDAGTSASTNFLGTTDAADLVQRTNSTERLRVFSTGPVGLTNTKNVAGSLIFYEASGLGTRYTAVKAGLQTATVHYILPPADGLPNQALVTDGAGNLSWHTFATFGGSGSQSIWKRGSAAGGEYSDSSGNSDSGPYSIAAGHNLSVTGNYEVVFGNANSGVSGSYGSVHGGSNNGSTGDKDVVYGGYNNTASATASLIMGGSGNSTSGNDEAVLCGSGGSFSGSNSTILGGINGKTSCNQELLYGLLGATAGTCSSVIFKIGSHTKFGIGTVAPAEFLDVRGNIRFSKVLKPNGTGGTSGNWLTSAGANLPPTWAVLTVPATNWKLLGNSGTLPGTNFIGTTDANSFVIRTSNSERERILSTGEVGVNISAPTNKLHSVLTGTTDETAAVYANNTGSTGSQSVGAWGIANTSAANTGTLALLGTGNADTAAGTTNVALQISDGEFTTGRTTELPSKGSVVSGANLGVLYTDQGPAGIVELGLAGDLGATAPTSGVYQDLGTFTITNRYATANSIIVLNVVDKINGGGSPDPLLAIYRTDIESRAAGSFVVHVSMIPTATDPGSYQGSDKIRIGYVIVNPGR